MKLLVGYATTEGQSRKIARHVADRLADAGHMVELLSLTDGEGLALDRFDRAVLVASIHAGQYRKELTSFAQDNALWLRRQPVLFLSVSLAAAGHESEDWRGLDRIVEDFAEVTGWTPDRAEQVAGAYRPSEYDLFKRFIMRRIIATKDPGADLDTDREYTDWPALDALVDDWIVG
ncbi:flavodoxin domain-containing protein [Salibaculum sp.]|uniref:flavodoxin domain-containing protein n=1 Tax=Salibaculum sp. TaxID=2855480 RepID=UPI002B48484D|nr:flavodoxin domain-containing protein [Salibaculum sp.]HKL68084.1 flavodoxin domain-containing protein [Salibaculum sp.]